MCKNKVALLKEAGFQLVYSVSEAAKLAGISSKSMYRYIGEGSIRTVRPRGGMKIPRAELLRFLDITEKDIFREGGRS